MIEIKIDATGLEDIGSFFQKIKLVPKVDKAIRKFALSVERESKKRTPVDTGRLRASIATLFKPLGAVIKTGTNYAVYVHEGTRKMRGRPFMKQGVEAAIDSFKSDVVLQIGSEFKV